MGNVPKIRFKGYTDEWEQVKLDKLAEFNPKSKLPESFEYVDLESVMGTEIISHRTETRQTAPSRAQRVARSGDLFFQTVRPYQMNNHLFSSVDENYVFSTGYAQLRPHIDGCFLLGLVQTSKFVKSVMEKCTGTGYPAINANVLAKMDVSYTSNGKEQEKIGVFLSALDALIHLYQRKCDALEKTKLYFLQNLFPRKGERVPRIRFDGFSGEWEERKLGELAEFAKGSGYSKSDVKSAGTPLILYGRLYTKYETVISGIDTFADPRPGSVYSHGGEVIVPASGETAEEISVASVVKNSGVLLGGDLNIITPADNLDPVFLAVCISSGRPHDEMTKVAQGKSIVHLHINDLEKINLCFPQYDEQMQISGFFQNIERLISKYKRLQETLTALKQYLLNNMFV